MDDTELNSGIEYLKSHVKTIYSGLQISEELIENDNVIIRLANRRKSLGYL
jgi:hypothetical protein